MTYIESLYFSVQTNTKFAKYYANLMEKDYSKISIVIAYERRALRLLDIGLKNQGVEQLFAQNKQQKNDLTHIL
jgi:hypothetical protein